MRRLRLTLAVLLPLQLAVITALYWPQSDSDVEHSRGLLLAFDPDRVDEIHLDDGHGHEAVLLRRGEHWILPELGELPADRSRVEQLLAGLHPSDPGWPVADTSVARQRFQVADYHYQRRIRLIGRGELFGTIYLGTSPGFRRVHARSNDSQSIYSIPFNNFDAPGNGLDWLDRGLLRVRVPLAVSTELYDIRREGEGWRSGWDRVPDELELKTLLVTLENLRVEGVADEDTLRDLAALSPDLVLHVESLEGNSRLALFSSEGEHFLHSGRYRQFFRLSAWDYDRLTGIDPDRIMDGGNAPTAPE